MKRSNSRKVRQSVTLLLLALLTACDRSPVNASGPLPQRAYVWQRVWTPAVRAAVVDAREIPLVVLASQLSLQGDKAKPVRAGIDWSALQRCALAMRVDPFRGPFDDTTTTLVVDEARHVLAEAVAHHVECNELQLDFDCAQSKLSGYTRWVRALRTAIQPVRLSITTLPSWLDEPSFIPLVQSADGYVLQVHSVPPANATDRVAICDPVRAKRWIAKAALLGHPFEVALPTYSALVGLAPDGQVLGYTLEGPPPAWPPDTRVVAHESDADEMAALIREWTASHPALMRGVIWYRLPVATDERNWSIAQLRIVQSGRALNHRMDIQAGDSELSDIILTNGGEASEPLAGVRVTWRNANLVASEALPGFQAKAESNEVIFSATGTQRLRPGASRRIGWLRFDQPAVLHVEILSGSCIQHP